MIFRISGNVDNNLVLVDYPAASGNVTIPDNVFQIAGVFMYNTNITSVTFSNNILDITGGAFLGCTNIKNITIPVSVEWLGYDTFSMWTSSQTINVPFANQAAADAAWGVNWRRNCNAKIVYYQP
jgi:hypothetical protein